jgi:hypothetical protein
MLSTCDAFVMSSLAYKAVGYIPNFTCKTPYIMQFARLQRASIAKRMLRGPKSIYISLIYKDIFRQRSWHADCTIRPTRDPS